MLLTRFHSAKKPLRQACRRIHLLKWRNDSVPRPEGNIKGPAKSRTSRISIPDWIEPSCRLCREELHLGRLCRCSALGRISGTARVHCRAHACLHVTRQSRGACLQTKNKAPRACRHAEGSPGGPPCGSRYEHGAVEYTRSRNIRPEI